MDWHPCVTNQLAIALAGEMEMEVGGGGEPLRSFMPATSVWPKTEPARDTSVVSAELCMWSSWLSKQKTSGRGRSDSWTTQPFTQCP